MFTHVENNNLNQILSQPNCVHSHLVTSGTVVTPTAATIEPHISTRHRRKRPSRDYPPGSKKPCSPDSGSSGEKPVVAHPDGSDGAKGNHYNYCHA